MHCFCACEKILSLHRLFDLNFFFLVCLWYSRVAAADTLHHSVFIKIALTASSLLWWWRKKCESFFHSQTISSFSVFGSLLFLSSLFNNFFLFLFKRSEGTKNENFSAMNNFSLYNEDENDFSRHINFTTAISQF